MNVYPTPLITAALSLIVCGTLTAKNSMKSPKGQATSITISRMSTLAPPKTVARRSERGRQMTSRGELDDRMRERMAVLFTSPKAILVEKSARRLTIYENGAPLKTYLSTIGRNAAAAKTKAGDWATPEGLYRVRRKNPRSKYYLALHIDYPNTEDAERGLATGLIGPSQYASILNAHAKGVMPPQNTRLGYYIEIHGDSNKVVQGENGQPALAGWTRGCVGMRNQDIEEIYAWSPNGTPVLILP